MRLIDAEKMIDAVLEYNASFAKTSQPVMDGIRKATCKDMIDLIIEQPTVEVSCSENQNNSVIDLAGAIREIHDECVSRDTCVNCPLSRELCEAICPEDNYPSDWDFELCKL